jgi:hypothetical protein
MKNKIIPTKKTECDCCMEENKTVIVCPKNNKCEYAMCEDCIYKLKTTSKSKKCPACREEIFDDIQLIDIKVVLNDTEEELNDIEELDEYVHYRIRFWCCSSMYQYIISVKRERLYYNNLVLTFKNVIDCISSKLYCCPIFWLMVFSINIYRFYFYIRKNFRLNHNSDDFICKKNKCTIYLANTITFIIYISSIFAVMSLGVFVSNLVMRHDYTSSIFCEPGCFIFNSIIGICLLTLAYPILLAFVNILGRLIVCLSYCEDDNY